MREFEKHNPAISLNIFYTKGNEVCPAYILKINSNCKKQIILSMIPDKEKKRMSLSCSKPPSTLLKGMIPQQHGNFCCLNCLCSFKTEIDLNLMKKYVKRRLFVEL